MMDGPDQTLDFTQMKMSNHFTCVNPDDQNFDPSQFPSAHGDLNPVQLLSTDG
jgi:hypothetical protein